MQGTELAEAGQRLVVGADVVDNALGFEPSQMERVAAFQVKRSRTLVTKPLPFALLTVRIDRRSAGRVERQRSRRRR